MRDCSAGKGQALLPDAFGKAWQNVVVEGGREKISFRYRSPPYWEERSDVSCYPCGQAGMPSASCGRSCGA